MPMEIINKQKTDPKCPSQHKNLVPLRVVSVSGLDEQHRATSKEVKPGDIIFTIGGWGQYCDTIINATNGSSIHRKWNEDILCVRAYDIQRIVLTNDNEPAPVV